MNKKITFYLNIENEVMPQECCSWQQLPKLKTFLKLFPVANVLADMMQFDQNMTNYSENNLTVIDLKYIFEKCSKMNGTLHSFNCLRSFFGVFLLLVSLASKNERSVSFFWAVFFKRCWTIFYVSFSKLKKNVTTKIQSLWYLGIFLLQSFWQ